MANYHPLVSYFLGWRPDDEPATELQIPPFIRESIDAYKQATLAEKAASDAERAVPWSDTNAQAWVVARQMTRIATEARHAAAIDLADSLVIALDEDRD